jgi:putative ABC transport system permease protein
MIASTVSWLGLTFRRLRDERSSAIAFFVLVLVSSLLAALAPRLLDRVADGTLRSELLAQPVAPRSIQLIEEERINPSSDDPMGGPKDIASTLYARLPAEVQSIVSEQAIVAESGRYRVTAKLNDPTTMRLRIQPGAETRIRMVAGRMPTDAIQTEPSYTIEVAIAASSATALKVGIGDTVPLDLDPTDPLVGRARSNPILAKVVGTFEVLVPDDPWWLGDPGLAGPVTRPIGADSLVIDTTALLTPEEYPRLLDATASGLSSEGDIPTPIRLTFREYVDPDLIREADLPTLVPALRKLESTYPNANVRRVGFVTAGEEAVALRTGLRAFLVAHAARWSAALKILSVTAVGPAAVGLAALALAAAFAGRRRRAALSLARGRGASMAQIGLAVVSEAILVSLPAAFVAGALTVLLLPGDPALGTVRIAVIVGGLAATILSLVTLPGIRVAALGGGREAARPLRPSSRRLVFEGLVVVLAVVGTVLLRQRGVAAASSAGSLQTADPFIAAVPALAGLAAGLLAVRIVPLIVTPLARLARAGRGLVVLLALRRAAAGGTAGVLLVLLATSTIGAFSVGAIVDLDRAADTVAWHDVGADYLVSGTDGPLLAHYDFATVPGVEAAATMFRGRAAIANTGTIPDLAAIDLDRYDDVTVGTPAADLLPAELFGPATEPLPVVVSDTLAARADGLKVGDTARIRVQGYTFEAKAVASRATFPGLEDTSLFIIANRDQLTTLFPTAPLQASYAFLRAGPDAAARIRSTIAASMPATVAGRAELLTTLRETPVVQAIRLGIAAAAIVAGVYAALAVAVALVLAGSARAIELAHLRTLGLADWQASGILLAEHLPALVVAFAAGLGLGIGLFTALAPGLGLDALVGAEVQLSPPVDAGLLVLTAAGLVVVVLLGLGLGMLVGRSTSPVAALRRGFE